MNTPTTLLTIALLIAIVMIARQRGTIRSQLDCMKAYGIAGSVPPYPLPRTAPPAGNTEPSHLRGRGIDRDVSPETDSAIRALHQIERHERAMCTSDNIALDGESVYAAGARQSDH